MDISSYKDLWDEVRLYLKLQLNYGKLTIVEKVAVLLSVIAVAEVCLIIGAGVIFYLSDAMLDGLTVLFGCRWLASLIVAAVFIVIFVFVLALRKVLIVTPVVKFVTKLFLSGKE